MSRKGRRHACDAGVMVLAALRWCSRRSMRTRRRARGADDSPCCRAGPTWSAAATRSSRSRARRRPTGSTSRVNGQDGHQRVSPERGPAIRRRPGRGTAARRQHDRGAARHANRAARADEPSDRRADRLGRAPQAVRLQHGAVGPRRTARRQLLAPRPRSNTSIARHGDVIGAAAAIARPTRVQAARLGGAAALPIVATTTTALGKTVPYIVRVESGTINRAIYRIAILDDPSRAASARGSPATAGTAG